MKTTVRIGEVIFSILRQFDRVYPLVADEGTSFPFIVYKRSSGNSQSNKDGRYSAFAVIDIMVAASEYEDGVELANKVIETVENANGNIAGFDILEIRMIDSNESFAENTFIQEMRFQVEFSTI